MACKSAYANIVERAWVLVRVRINRDRLLCISDNQVSDFPIGFLSDRA
jgi:hypothetical protein